MKQQKKFNISILLTILVLLILPVFAIEEDDEQALFNAPNVVKGSILNIKDCVALAFKNSPKVKRKKYELDISKSNIGIAKSRYFPVLSGGVGFNYERNSNSIYYDKKYRDLPYVALSVNQLIYDFGKTSSNIKMEEFFKIIAEYEFVDEVCHTLFDIKQKYYNLLKTLAMFELAKKDVEINREFVKISKAKSDSLTAQINLNNSEIKLLKAQKELQNAKYDLSNSMYLDNHIDYKINNTLTFDFDINMNTKEFKPVFFSFKNEEAPGIAYKNSPDLEILINTKHAMEQSLKLVKKSYMPDLTASVGYNLNDTYKTTNNSLLVGVGLVSDINIKEVKHNIDIAKSELNIADNEINLFKKSLYYEVQRALNNFEREKNQIPISIKEVSGAYDNLEFIKKEYNKNQTGYTELQNARKDYIEAVEQYIDNLYDYNLAIIQIEMAMHYHIVDIHHKTEHALHNHADELIEHLNEAFNCREKENKKTKTKRNNKEKSK